MSGCVYACDRRLRALKCRAFDASEMEKASVKDPRFGAERRLCQRGRTARPCAATYETRNEVRRDRPPGSGYEGEVAIPRTGRSAVHIDRANNAEWAMVVAERSLGRRARKYRGSAMTAQRGRDEGWVLCRSDSWTCRSNRKRKALQGKCIG
jgi:hypothetical protein